MADPIAALSTPPGRGGIGIVRLSGTQSATIAAQLVRLNRRHDPDLPTVAGSGMGWEHAHARLAEVFDRNGSTHDRIDTAMVTFFAAPNSYTGDDLVEIAAHGSPVVLELLLR